jgi:hypothetical protein
MEMEVEGYRNFDSFIQANIGNKIIINKEPSKQDL